MHAIKSGAVPASDQKKQQHAGKGITAPKYFDTCTCGMYMCLLGEIYNNRR